MATERDAIEAVQNRWKHHVDKLKAELAHAEEMVRFLELAKHDPEDAGMMPIARVAQATPIIPPAPQNVGITQLIREYIRDHVKEDEKIDIPTLARWLIDKGCKGKYRNIYSGCHVILRKEQMRHRGVGYDKDVGFFKQVREDGSKAVSVPRMSMRMTD